MQAKKTGMAEIAEIAGVSVVTVHRALSNKTDISKATRRRILEVAESTGYRPSRLASSLRSRRTATIGIVTPHLGDQWRVPSYTEVDKIAQKHGYDLIIASSFALNETGKQRKAIEMLLGWNVEGLIIFPNNAEDDSAYLRKVAGQGVPLVLAGEVRDKLPIDLVAMDDRAAGRLAASHLMEIGCRNIGIITTTPASGAAWAWANRRVESATQTLAEAGRTPPTVVSEQDRFPEEEIHTSIHRTMLDFFDTPNRPPMDGVFAVTDRLAMGVAQACNDRNVEIPGKLAIIGYDNDVVCEATRPTLSTMARSDSELGRKAAELLFRRIRPETGTGETERILLPPELIVRESTRRSP